jgi:hypothetical protein
MPSPPDTDGVTTKLEFDLIMEDYKEERKIIIRNNAKIRSTASQMFTQIMVHWDEIETEEDLVRLWNRVKATHLITTSSNSELDKLRERNLYNSLKKFKNESLASFKLRTTNALKVIEVVQEKEPSAQAQAMDFISRIDVSKFGK